MTSPDEYQAPTGLHTVAQSTLTRQVGAVDEVTMERVCAAVSYALGC
jgi:hypothetical protein